MGNQTIIAQALEEQEVTQQKVGNGKVYSADIIVKSIPNQVEDKNLLYDYHQKEFEVRKAKVTDSAALAMTHKHQFGLIDKEYDTKNDEKTKALLQKLQVVFCKFYRNDNFYYAMPINDEPQNQIWLDISSLPIKFYPIQKGDILRLGQVVVEVRSMIAHDEKPPQSNLRKEGHEFKQNLYEDVFEETVLNEKITEKLCRICKTKGTNMNPLVAPCKCSGADRYAHLDCMIIWFETNFSQKNHQFHTTIHWNCLKCNNCKDKYKFEYKLDGQKVRIAVLPKPQPPYIIFQFTSINSAKEKVQVLEIIPMKQFFSVTIGNSIESQILLSNDPSISNVHCQLTYDRQSKKFLLSDLKSRYGTLVKVKKYVKIRPHHPGINLQIADRVFHVTSLRKHTTEKISNFDNGHRIFPDPKAKGNITASQKDNK